MKLTDAQIAHLQSLERAGGILTPDDVVADAKLKTSPIHDLFDWDKSKAAHQWFLECAREIIRSVRVQVTTIVFETRPQGYTRDPDANGKQGYRSFEALKRDPDAARRSLCDEIERISGALSRARSLSVALDLEHDFDDLIARLMAIHARAKAA